MRRDRVGRAALIAIVSLLLAGCIPVPLPTKAKPPRFSEAQLAAVAPGTGTRESVAGLLGHPELRRAGDRLWIYLWRVESGQWFALPLLPLIAGNVGPINSDLYLLVLEFDEAGVLRTRSFAQPAKGSRDDRHCTEGGVCIEHPVASGTTANGLVQFKFLDAWSAVSIDGDAKVRYAWPDGGKNECVAVLWADEGWSKSGGLWHSTPHGVPVRIDDLQDKWSPTWLPVGASAVLALAEGQHTVEAMSPWAAGPYFMQYETQRSAATFECRAGERVNLAIGASSTKGDRFPIVLKRVEETIAQDLTAHMRRLLMPERQ
jgi:hypothetical protein